MLQKSKEEIISILKNIEKTEKGGNISQLILQGWNYPDYQYEKRHSKKMKDQISHKYR